MDNWWIKVFAYTMATIIVLAGVFMFCAVVSLPFWLLWNWLMPNIFGLPEITWLQAFGLWLLITLLRSNNINKYKKLFDSSDSNETDGSEKSPFGDNTWNQWVEQVKKKYSA
jgi:hypothetical protein